MQIVKISEVKPNPKNPRIIKDGKFQKLVKSIQEFPDMLNKRPLVVFTDVDGKYIVLGGNMRLKACKEIGLKEIPIIVADEWTEEQKHEFLIKDNVGFGEWDWDSLTNEWDVEKLDDWGLDLPVDLSVQEELEAEEDNYEIPNEINTDIVLGDLFEIGEHRLLCGDSTDSDQVAKLMNGEKADMVFTDPPYGMFLDSDYSKIHKAGGKKYDKVIGDNEDFTPELINTIFSIFNDCKEIFIWGADYFIDLIPNFGKDGSWLVWNKRNSESKFEKNADSDLQKKVTGNSFELCWSKQKHKRLIYHCFWNGSLGEGEFENRTKAQTVIRNHPTQKPILLFMNILKDFGNKNDLVADLFLGSGSTMVASHQLKRKCYGMELDPKYCQVIIDRMKKLDPSLVIKKNGVEIK
jgi:DNA modification methylase